MALKQIYTHHAFLKQSLSDIFTSNTMYYISNKWILDSGKQMKTLNKTCGQDNGKYLKEKNRNALHISTFSVNRLNRRSPLSSISDERSNYDKRQNIKLNSWLHTWIVDSGIRYTACWFIYWYKCMPYNILIYINSRKLHL